MLDEAARHRPPRPRLDAAREQRGRAHWRGRGQARRHAPAAASHRRRRSLPHDRRQDAAVPHLGADAAFMHNRAVASFLLKKIPGQGRRRRHWPRCCRTPRCRRCCAAGVQDQRHPRLRRGVGRRPLAARPDAPPISCARSRRSSATTSPSTSSATCRPSRSTRSRPCGTRWSATLKKHDPEGVPVPYLAPGFTDAKSWSRLGTRCYGFMPVRFPDDGTKFADLFHGHDERIPVEGLQVGRRPCSTTSCARSCGATALDWSRARSCRTAPRTCRSVFAGAVKVMIACWSPAGT